MYINVCANCGRQTYISKHKPKRERIRYCKKCRGLAHKYYMKGYKKARYQNLKEQVTREVRKALKFRGIDLENGKDLSFNEVFK